MKVCPTCDSDKITTGITPPADAKNPFDAYDRGEWFDKCLVCGTKEILPSPVKTLSTATEEEQNVNHARRVMISNKITGGVA